MYKLNSYLANKHYLNVASVVIGLLLSSSSFALKDDIEKPVYINADSVLFNKTKGQGVYEGNVSIVQGSLEMRATKIEISAPGGEIKKNYRIGFSCKLQTKNG